MKKWVRDAGIMKKICWHMAQQAFATVTLVYGADAITVASILGQMIKYAKTTDGCGARQLMLCMGPV